MKIIDYKNYKEEYLFINGEYINKYEMDIKEYVEKNNNVCPLYATGVDIISFEIDLADIIYNEASDYFDAEDVFDFSGEEFQELSKKVAEWIDEQCSGYYEEDDDIKIDLSELIERYGWGVNEN